MLQRAIVKNSSRKPRPRLQPEARGSGESKNSILKAAEELFAAKGFEQTTLKEISLNSGANGALVSYYFGSKDGLKDAVIARKRESLREVLEPILHKTALVPEDLREMVFILLTHVKKDESFHRLAMRALLEDKALTENLSTSLWQPLFEKFCSVIDRATQGQLSREEVEIRCVSLCAQINHYANLRFFHKDSFPSLGDFEDFLKRYEAFIANRIVDMICR